jgi:hypothetical protein
MTPFLVGLGSPGKRLASTRENRSPERLLSIIAEHHFRGHTRYTPRDVTGDGIADTWCNLFAQDVCEAMSVMLPRHMRANELAAWLTTKAHEFDWEGVTPHIAQRMADEGQLAVACWTNPDGPGHIVVLVPSLGEPGEWCAQAGGSRFTRGTIAQAFGSKSVLFFGHP